MMVPTKPLEAVPMRRAPGEQVKAQPWSFVVAALGAGLAAGFFLKAKSVRKLLKYYMLIKAVRPG